MAAPCETKTNDHRNNINHWKCTAARCPKLTFDAFWGGCCFFLCNIFSFALCPFPLPANRYTRSQIMYVRTKCNAALHVRSGIVGISKCNNQVWNAVCVHESCLWLVRVVCCCVYLDAIFSIITKMNEWMKMNGFARCMHASTIWLALVCVCACVAVC